MTTKGRGTDLSNPDSTHDLLAGWNIEEPDEFDRSTTASARLDRAHATPLADASRRHSAGIAREDPTGGNLDVFPGFVLGESRAEVSTGLDDLVRVRTQPLFRQQSASRWRGPRRSARGSRAGPRHGARRRAGRPAWPVSRTPATSWRASGSSGNSDEGRLRASTWPRRSTWVAGSSPSRCHDPKARSRRSSPRLQHTHIVPVHSVCDDPKTGLRVLCMPYFGGANLAQVLDAAGGLDQTEHRRPQSRRGPRPPQPAPPPTARPGFARRRASTARPASPRSPVDLAASSSQGACRREGSIIRGGLPVPLLALTGWSERGPRRRSRLRAPFHEDQHQPARQFLQPGQCHPGGGLDRRAAGRRAGPRPLARLAPPRPEAGQHLAGCRRHSDVAGFQPGGREPP